MPQTAPPPIGQQFLDDEGFCWTVRNLILSDTLDGFFLVRLDVGRTAGGKEETVVLAPLEYEALVRSRGLKPTAPDVVQPLQSASNDPSVIPPITVAEPTDALQ